jgi:hypothetical protein
VHARCNASGRSTPATGSVEAWGSCAGRVPPSQLSHLPLFPFVTTESSILTVDDHGMSLDNYLMFILVYDRSSL